METDILACHAQCAVCKPTLTTCLSRAEASTACKVPTRQIRAPSAPASSVDDPQS